MSVPALTPFATITVEVGAPVAIDAAPGQGRRFIPILGGAVEGELAGRVLPGGGDWQTIWSDGRMDLSAHYVLEIDGNTVEVVSEGLRHGAPEVLSRLARGEPVDAGEYYFRTSIRLRTAAASLSHVNSRLYIAVGERLADRVRLRVFDVG